MNKVLGLLGLAKKAGQLEVGEEPTGAAARARDARLLLIASDAADNSCRRLKHFADAGACLYVKLPCTKDELGSALGRTSCAMAAVTDVGFAEAIAAKLAEDDPERYGEIAQKLHVKAQRAAERRREMARHERNVRTGKKKTVPKEKSAEAPAAKAAQSSKAPSRRAEGPKEREKRRRESEKRKQFHRFEGARPVRFGKGSVKKEKSTQHKEV